MKTESMAAGNNGNTTEAFLQVLSTANMERLLEWVCLGASQVQNNVACVEKHRQSLRALGETEQRLKELDHWRDSSAFTDREKAALSLTETVSLPEPEELSTRVLTDAGRHLTAEEILRLTLAIVAVNDWIAMHEKPARILVVEDDPYDQELLVRQLQKTHMEDKVLFASDGIQALEIIELFRSAATWELVSIFLDLSLPGMHGIELLQRIRRMPGLEDFPVIIMTSSNDPRHLEECTRLKVLSYIKKPITFSSFANSIANIFHRPATVRA